MQYLFVTVPITQAGAFGLDRETVQELIEAVHSPASLEELNSIAESIEDGSTLLWFEKKKVTAEYSSYEKAWISLSKEPVPELDILCFPAVAVAGKIMSAQAVRSTDMAIILSDTALQCGDTVTSIQAKELIADCIDMVSCVQLPTAPNISKLFNSYVAHSPSLKLVVIKNSSVVEVLDWTSTHSSIARSLNNTAELWQVFVMDSKEVPLLPKTSLEPISRSAMAFLHANRIFVRQWKTTKSMKDIRATLATYIDDATVAIVYMYRAPGIVSFAVTSKEAIAQSWTEQRRLQIAAQMQDDYDYL